MNAAERLVTENLNEPYSLRSIGISTCDLSSNKKNVQINIFDEAINNEKLEHLEKTLDSLKTRFGIKCIKKASLLKDNPLTKINDENIISFKTDL